MIQGMIHVTESGILVPRKHILLMSFIMLTLTTLEPAYSISTEKDRDSLYVYIDNSIDSLNKLARGLLAMSMVYDHDEQLYAIQQYVSLSEKALENYRQFLRCYNECDSCMWCRFGLINQKYEFSGNLNLAKMSSVMLTQAGQDARFDVLSALELMERIWKALDELEPPASLKEEAFIYSIMREYRNKEDSALEKR